MTDPVLPNAAVPPTLSVDVPRVCADCATPFAGNFCPHCGQEANIQPPTVRHFLRELLDQFIAMEGKIWRTLRVLILRPGMLTEEYLQGRRQRYVRPLKLYLSASVLFFTLFSLWPDQFTQAVHAPLHGRVTGATTEQSSIKFSSRQLSQRNDKSNAEVLADQLKIESLDDDPAPTAKSGSLALTQENKGRAANSGGESALGASGAELNKANSGENSANSTQNSAKKAKASKRAVHSEAQDQEDSSWVGESTTSLPLEALADHVGDADKQRQMREKLANEAPYAMFFLVPYLALILRWFYRAKRRLYAEHLLFSLHLHTFAFIVLVLGFIPLGFIQTLVDWMIGVYLFLALRGFYGGGWAATLWRMAGIYVMYLAAIAATALSGVLAYLFGGQA